MKCWGIFLVSLVVLPTVSNSAQFTDVTDELFVGIDASSDQGPGCAFGDIDNNGYLDIVVVDGLGDPNVVFRQDGLRNFVEVGGTVGLDDNGWGKSVTFADYDNDGDADLLLTRLGQSNILYENNGGIFTDVTAGSGLELTGANTGAAWADFDNDGLLDVYITKYNSIPNHLMRNLGGGVFEDVAVATGCADATGYGFQPGFFDYDNDGDQDIYVSNDVFGTANALFRNDGGTFTDVSASSGAGIDMSAMGLAIGDYDNNGFLDLYVANISTGNVFLANNGDGTFTERADELGVGAGVVCWGTDFLDFDHDGLLDLYVNVSSDEYIAEEEGSPEDDTGRGELLFSNILYRNTGTGFEDVSETCGADNPGRSFSSAVADYDNDGDLDIYVTNWYEIGLDKSTALYENNHIPRGENASDWLRVNLIGTVSNRDAVGARVWIETDVGWITRERQAGTSYLASSDPVLHFGTGTTTSVSRLYVRWPSGLTELYTNVATGQTIILIEGDGAPTSVLDENEFTNHWSIDAVAPNPISNGATIQLRTGGEEGLLSLHDVGGRLLRTFPVSGQIGDRVDLRWDGRDSQGSPVPAGSYYLKLQSGSRVVGAQKVVVIE